jgi:hypothetical protein
MFAVIVTTFARRLNVTGGEVAASVLQRSAIAAMMSVARVIAPVYIILSLLCAEQKGTIHRVKYWEIIADNLGKAGWSWGCII